MQFLSLNLMGSPVTVFHFYILCTILCGLETFSTIMTTLTKFHILKSVTVHVSLIFFFFTTGPFIRFEGHRKA